MKNKHPKTPDQIGGGKPGPGRKAGVPNKNTTALKDMILGALEAAGDALKKDGGGQAYLAHQAQENPSAFMALIGKVLPTTIQGGDGTKDGEPIVIHLHAGPRDKPGA